MKNVSNIIKVCCSLLVLLEIPMLGGCGVVSAGGKKEILVLDRETKNPVKGEIIVLFCYEKYFGRPETNPRDPGRWQECRIGTGDGALTVKPPAHLSMVSDLFDTTYWGERYLVLAKRYRPDTDSFGPFYGQFHHVYRDRHVFIPTRLDNETIEYDYTINYFRPWYELGGRKGDTACFRVSGQQVLLGGL